MPWLPLMVNLEEQWCLVVGGGPVAERKTRLLLEAGARVRVVSPHLTPTLQRWAKEGRIEHRARPFREEDVEGIALAVAATDEEAVNRRVSQAARQRRVWVNVTMSGEEGTVLFTAFLRRGKLVVAVSTSGTCPSLAQHLRDELEQQWGSEYETWSDLLQRFRAYLRKAIPEPSQRRRILQRAVQSEALNVLRREGKEAAWNHLLNCISSPSESTTERHP